MIAHHVVALARETDAAAISALSAHAIEHGFRQMWTAQRVTASIHHRETNVVVVRIGSALAGFGIMQYGDDEAQLSLLAVDVPYRRRGVASAMIAWLETAARDAGMSAIWLQVRAGNAGAIAFYRQLGFRDLGLRHGYYQGIEDALFMALDTSFAR